MKATKNWSGILMTRLCTLSTFIQLVYNTCQSQHAGSYILRFADDSVIVSLLSCMVSDNSPAVSEFTDWCKASLDINVSETKDMIIDF